MSRIWEDTRGKIRDAPINSRLRIVLQGVAEDAGVDTVRITSGGQPGSSGGRVGSTRHDDGNAADLQLIVGDRTLTFTDQDADPRVKAFVTAAAARGAIGIGAGVGYMGPQTLHVGFGLSPRDRSKLVWGAGGRSANAPNWLRRAAEEGWGNLRAAAVGAGAPPREGGLYQVAARGGLRLRGGPGTEFGVITTLETGRTLTVLSFEGSGEPWARVDLEDDGLVDGYVFAGFLARAGSEGREADGREDAEEPGEEAA